MTLRVRNKGEAARALRKEAEDRERRQLRAATRVALTMEREVKRTLSAPPGPDGLFGPTGAAGSALAVRHGRLRNSVNSGVRASRIGGKLNLVSFAGTPIAYAKIHEYGGTIKGRPLLFIPTKYARQFSHLLRGHVVKRGHSPTTATLYKSAIFKSRGGSLFVWAIQGRGARYNVKPIALLVPKVEMRKREPFGATFRRIVEQLRAIVIREVTA